MSVNKNRGFRPKKRKNKLVLVFDEDARREFLTGFHKRKLQRKNKAKEEFEMQLKLERKRIKAEAREAYKKLLLTQKTIPDIEDLHSEEIDMGTHCVSVKELSATELAKRNNWIGTNEVQYEERNDKADHEESHKEFEDDSELEGMEIKSRKKKKLNKTEDALRNCRDIKKAIKKQATLNVKNSKIFKKKAKIEKIKNIKQHRRQERKKQKLKKKGKRCKNLK